MKDSNKKFDNLIHKLYDIMRFCHDNNCKSEYIIYIQEVIIIINIIKGCDETSATRCFNNINDVKNIIKDSRLL